MAGIDAMPPPLDWPPLHKNVPTVQLRHTMADGSWHVDWLIGRDEAGAMPLICFRLTRPLAELEEGVETVIERIADHRPEYLEYEGELTGGRGCVTRLDRGTVAVQAVREQSIELASTWSGPRSGAEVPHRRLSAGLDWFGEVTGDPRWHLRAITWRMADEINFDPPSATR